MTPEDFEQLAAVSAAIRKFDSVGVLSPLRRGGERRLFPHATMLERHVWDLDHAGTHDFDVLIAANVFMYSERPQVWFENVLSRSAFLFLIDLIRRKRGSESEFGPDGDCMRFAVGEERPRNPTPCYDLTSLGDRLLGYRTYSGGASTFDGAPVHIAALIRGYRDAPSATAHVDVILDILSRPLDDEAPRATARRRGLRRLFGL